MIPTNTKNAEKEYLGRTGSSTWERTKPFSPAGAETLTESAHLLHDFAAALLTLHPDPDDLILDLGAGGCWCSDLLGRLNRSAVAVDLSLEMLQAGRARPGRFRAVAGDMESLPFATGVFQKAICLNAIHHVPDVGKAVREIARVLDDEGVALFSEPGRGHTDAPVSAAAVRDYGVLEQDILVGPFVRQCRDGGFAEGLDKALVACRARRRSDARGMGRMVATCRVDTTPSSAREGRFRPDGTFRSRQARAALRGSAGGHNGANAATGCGASSRDPGA